MAAKIMFLKVFMLIAAFSAFFGNFTIDNQNK